MRQRRRRAQYKRMRRRWLKKFSRLADMNEQLDEREKHLRLRQEKRRESLMQKLAQPRRLGRHMAKAPEMEVKLPDELMPSLRQMKPEGNMIKDRIYSMVRRNMLEHRERTKRSRDYKTKKYQNRAHKNFEHSFDQRLSKLGL